MKDNVARSLSLAFLIILATPGLSRAEKIIPNLKPFPDASGEFKTFSSSGAIDLSGPFFTSLGTNGRSCVSCHDPKSAWTITPALLLKSFNATRGLDPVFRTNDGSVSPDADVSTFSARRHAYAMLLNKGLIRVGLPIPKGAEFELEKVDDPYGFASAKELSLFRRPLPATNLSFLSAVMWDGRESTPGNTLFENLEQQADDATMGHAQGQALSSSLKEEIVTFETSLYSAQTVDRKVGMLDDRGAKGGPIALSQQPFFIGINDPTGANPTGEAFNPEAFTLFQAWSHIGEDSEARHSIARGEQLFNTFKFEASGVRGLNDVLGVKKMQVTCTTCHDAPNVGDHSIVFPLDLGLTDLSRRTADLPLYTLRNLTTGETIQTTDPGRALISGKWKDIGKFKGPILRALAARPPYFHNGSAATLEEVIDFYDSRFSIGFTPRQKTDLANFLRSL